MDLKLRSLERAYLADPRIETLLPYANETIRAGLYSVLWRRSEWTNVSHRGLFDANETLLDACFYDAWTDEMLVMQHIETQRRRNIGEAWLHNPDSVALWMSCDGFEPNAAWVYNGFVLG